MTRVVGLDLSLSRTGYAACCWDARVPEPVWPCGTIPSKPEPGASHDQKVTRLRRLRAEIRNVTAAADLVVVEGPSFGSHGRIVDLGGLWWGVCCDLQRTRVPVAVAPPGTLKKFATGRGNASKDLVGYAAARKWPHMENNDEADALWLAHMGRSYLLQCVRALYNAPRYQLEALLGVEWPPTPGDE